MKLTRRELAAVVSVSALAGAPSASQPQPASPPDELSMARERLRHNAGLLAQQPVPMDTEPAFQFKV